METVSQTSKEYIKGLTIIHAAMMLGQVILGLIFFYNNSNAGLVYFPGTDNEFKVIASVMIVVCLLGGNYLFKIRMQTAKQKTELKEKLNDYRTNIIIKYALMEGATLFSLCCYLMTSNYFYLILSGIVVFFFLINRPTRAAIVLALDLNPHERQLLDDSNAIVAEVKKK